MTNKEIAEVFGEIADILELKEENPFRIRSYRRAADVIFNQPVSLEEAISEDPEKVRSLPGIGDATFRKIRELAETGECKEHQQLLDEVPSGLLQMLELKDLGPKRIVLFWKSKGISTIDELEEAAAEEQLRSLPGMGAKSEKKILQAIEEYRRREGRFRLDHAQETAQAILEYLRAGNAVDRVVVAGSLRRRRESIGDIDILVSTNHPEAFCNSFATYPDFREITARGPTKVSAVTRRGIQVDLRVVPSDSYGAALQYFTGSQSHNVALRERAKRLGFKVNEYGLFRLEDGERVAGENEEDIYRELDLAFISPQLRENRGEIEAAEKNSLPEILESSDIRGDLHCHTTASDGRNTVEEMASTAQAAGYEYLGITDHSKALAMTGGLDEERVLDQITQIDRFNKSLSSFRVLHGIEVDILVDGSLDLEDDVLDKLDVVIASIHSRFNMTRDEMTERICRALEHPAVNILAHPTGRLIVKREAYEVDLEKVIRTAVSNRVCLEINAYPARLDLNDIHSRMAKDAGALISINSDSHSTQMLHYMDYGVDTARRAWLTAQDVINTLPLERLLQVLRKDLYR